MRRRRPILPTTPVTAVVEKLSHDGRGIARVDGKTTFIEGALARETVTFEYTRRKSDFDEGRVLTVVTPSEQRVDPVCPHYDLCGGCSFQHLDANEQIVEKQALLLDALMRIGHCQPETVLPPLVSASTHYRNKARLSVRYVEKKQATLVGFREKKNPRYITDIHTCSVLHAKVATNIDAIRQFLDNLDDPRCMAQIEVAAGDDDVAFIFRNMTALSSADEEKIKAFAEQTQIRIYLQPGGPDSVYLFHPPDASEWLTYQLPEFKIAYQFHPTDFTQVNSGINRLMVSLAVQLLALNSHDRVLDLFCGLGNFSLPLATQCEHVIGIEGSDAMVKRASMNAALNQLDNTVFSCANLDDENALDSVLEYGINKMLVDPPRTGALAIVKQIDKIKPERLVYVSCNPITLARDADILVNQHGYRLISAGVMDMFPHTSHVESIALFVRE